MESGNNLIERNHFLEAAAYLLLETFEGSPEGQGSAYLDRRVGLFPTLEKLTADDVSMDFYGTTIVAQTEHAKFYLDRLCEVINGRSEKINWEDSWLIETVNETEWAALAQSLRSSYEDTLRCVAAVDDWNEDRIGTAIGIIAHTAYHLGAIRQIAKAVEQRDAVTTGMLYANSFS